MTNFNEGTSRKWANGGGQVQDWCEVAKTVYVDESSSIRQRAEVRGVVRLYDESCIAGEAKVFDDVVLVKGSRIGGNAHVSGAVDMLTSSVIDDANVSGNVRIVHSHVMGNSVVNGKTITLRDAIVKDKARVYDGAVLIGVTVADEAVVCETAHLEGDFRVDKAMRIHEGKWTRPPKFVDGGEVQLTECIDDKVIIGCQCHTRSWWRSHAYAIGKLYGWSASQVTRYFELMKEFD